MTIDYRELLKKYMKHVVACEGINFIQGYPGPGIDDVNASEDDVTFTNEEWSVLKAISAGEM